MIAHSVVIFTSLQSKRNITFPFSMPIVKSCRAVGVRWGGKGSKIIVFCTLLLCFIEAIALFRMPHLHLRAPFIMISCSLAHVQLVNLFALDQRKFPRGCIFFFSLLCYWKVRRIYSSLWDCLSLWAWISVNVCVIGLWSFHLFSLVGSER